MSTHPWISFAITRFYCSSQQNNGFSIFFLGVETWVVTREDACWRRLRGQNNEETNVFKRPLGKAHYWRGQRNQTNDDNKEIVAQFEREYKSSDAIILFRHWSRPTKRPRTIGQWCRLGASIYIVRTAPDCISLAVKSLKELLCEVIATPPSRYESLPATSSIVPDALVENHPCAP